MNYMPTVYDIIEILSHDIYPTLAVGTDLTPWQNACIDKIKSEGLHEINDNTMAYYDSGISVELLHAYIKEK